MNKHMRKYSIASLYVIFGTVTCFGAKLTVSPGVLRGIEPAALAANAKARAHVYRIDAQPRSHRRLKRMAMVVGISESAACDTARSRYSQGTDTSRAGAWHDESAGRYICFRESPSELTVASDFPEDLNTRAVALLNELALKQEEYMVTGMNAYVLQDADESAPVAFRRTYKFKRFLEKSVVLADEGSASVQFDRHGRPTLVEIPAVTLTPFEVAAPIDPEQLPKRLDAFAATKDTIVERDQTMQVDSVAACVTTYSFRKEKRNGREYLVPCQSVLVDYFPREGEPVRREHHFSLDRASRRYELVDPWMDVR